MQWGPRRDRVAITERVAAHQGWPLIKSGSTVITETRHYLYHTALLGSEVLQKLVIICNRLSVVITASVEHQLSSIYTYPRSQNENNIHDITKSMHIMVHVLITKFEVCSFDRPQAPQSLSACNIENMYGSRSNLHEEDMTMDSAHITIQTGGCSVVNHSLYLHILLLLVLF